MNIFPKLYNFRTKPKDMRTVCIQTSRKVIVLKFTIFLHVFYTGNSGEKIYPILSYLLSYPIFRVLETNVIIEQTPKFPKILSDGNNRPNHSLSSAVETTDTFPKNLLLW